MFDDLIVLALLVLAVAAAGGLVYFLFIYKDEEEAYDAPLAPESLPEAPIASDSPRVGEQAADKRRQGYRIDLYPPYDREARRDRFTRWAVFLLILVAIPGITTLFGYVWGALIGSVAGGIGGLIGFGLGTVILAELISRYLIVQNKEWSAYVTQDPFTGENIPYGPGWHVSFPWEQRNEEGNESLEVITRLFTVGVQTKTAKVEAQGSYQYAIDLANITNFIGNDASTIEEGFLAFIQSFLTEEYANLDAETARAKIGDTNERLADEFMGKEDGGLTPVDFERKFGLITVSVVIKGLILPQAVQDARNAIDEANTMFEVVARLHGMSKEELKTKRDSGEINDKTYKEWLNRAMTVSKTATMRINVIEGDRDDLRTAAFTNLLDDGNGKRG